MTFGQAAIIGNLFANDVKALHWHATGDDFDKIHAIAEELYDELLEEVDELAEMAIASGEKMPNLSDPNNLLDWQPFSEDFCNWPIFVETLQSKGMEYLNTLYDLASGDIKAGYKSVIEAFCYFWEKEISYKNGARAFGAEPEVHEADYRDLVVEYQPQGVEDDSLSDEVVDMFTYNDAKANNIGFEGFETTNGMQSMKTDLVVSSGKEVQPEEDEDENEE